MNYKVLLEEAAACVKGRVQAVRVPVAVGPEKKVFTNLVKPNIVPILGEQTIMDDQHKDFTGTP